MQVVDIWYLLVVVRGLGRAEMVVAERYTGRRVVEVLDCIARDAAAVSTDIRHRSVIVVCCMRPKEQRFLCSSSRQLVLQTHRKVCSGKDWAWDAVLVQADYTWHRPGCTYSIVSPRACGHSTGQRRKAWREDQAGCLSSQYRLRTQTKRQSGLTMLAHGLAVCSSELWS
jgi:hypothetical protein